MEDIQRPAQGQRPNTTFSLPFCKTLSTWRALLNSDVTAVGAQGCQGSLQRRRQRQRECARALPSIASCLALPLYASGETLTSVYADLKGGSVQWWGGGCVYTQIGKEGLL